MPVYIIDEDQQPTKRTLPGSQTIWDHFTHREMGENKRDYTQALIHTAVTFEIQTTDVENALIDISLLQRRGVTVH